MVIKGNVLVLMETVMVIESIICSITFAFSHLGFFCFFVFQNQYIPVHTSG